MSETYEFIDVECATVTAADQACAPTVTRMCSWLEVSKSGFYEWRSRPLSVTAKRREELRLLISKAFEDSDSTYGYRRVHAQLGRWGVAAGPELVRRLMRDLGLVSCQPRPWPGRADPGPGEPRLHRGCARPENGRRYYLHSHMAGLVLPRDCHRLRDEENRRLGDG